MQDLTLVGVHEDGEHVLLVAGDGQRYRLRVDEALRAAVRRDRPRLGQLQIEMDGKLRPKDIQARIRAGATADEVAAAAGLPVEHVRRFEGPVLGERAHVATQARRVVLRRGPAGSPTLAEQVEERLARREVEADAVGWDAWRTDEGLWTVEATYVAGSRERHARWSYDPRVQHVAPLDDEARWLTEAERPDTGALPQFRPGTVADRTGDRTGDRTADRTDGPADEEPAVAGGTTSDGPGTERDPQDDTQDEPQDDGASATVELLDTLRARRGRRARPQAPAEDDDGDPLEDLLGTLLTRSEVGADPARTEPLRDPGPNHPARRAGRDGRPTPGEATVATERTPDTDDDPAEPVEVHPGAGRPAARKSRRASVPSWDDIMFGARRE